MKPGARKFWLAIAALTAGVVMAITGAIVDNGMLLEAGIYLAGVSAIGVGIAKVATKGGRNGTRT
jgi:hypothetical protein